MIELVYILSAAVSVACALLLLRAYLRTRVRLLFWSVLAFTGLAVNDVLVWVDVRILPSQIDLSAWRLIPAVVGVALLCYGLITESA